MMVRRLDIQAGRKSAQLQVVEGSQLSQLQHKLVEVSAATAPHSQHRSSTARKGGHPCSKTVPFICLVRSQTAPTLRVTRVGLGIDTGLGKKKAAAEAKQAVASTASAESAERAAASAARQELACGLVVAGEVLAGLKAALGKVQQHAAAEPFLLPVPREVPTYYDRIERPVSLACIHKKLTARPCGKLPAPSGADKKSLPRGAPMQHLAPRQNPECSSGHFNTLDWDPHCTFPENTARVAARKRRAAVLASTAVPFFSESTAFPCGACRRLPAGPGPGGRPGAHVPELPRLQPRRAARDVLHVDERCAGRLREG